jgi:uncharacterized protein (TIGR03067 family)
MTTNLLDREHWREWNGRCYGGLRAIPPLFGDVQEIPMRWIPFFTLTLVLAVMETAKSDDSKDNHAIQGSWLAATAELDGKLFPDEARKSFKLTLKDDKYKVTVGKIADQGTVKLDPSAKPKAMDITGTVGPNKGKKILAIYELDGDTLKICYDLSGKSRPKEFKTTKGSQLFLVAYKREKR